MTTAGALSIIFLFFAAVIFLLIRRVWLRYRLIAVMVPRAGDPQVFSYKLIETIRGLGFRETSLAGGSGVYQPPAWLKWSVGLQDISVAPAGGEAVLVTGPGFWVSSVGRRFPGATRQRYDGRQPVWPLIKACLRLVAALLVLTVAFVTAAYLSGVR
jgi:hypothetical protein